jgi:hypothetical protein
MINKETIKYLTDEELRLCRNEFTKRWKFKHKDKVNAYARDYRKRKNPIGKTEIKEVKEISNLDVF